MKKALVGVVCSLLVALSCCTLFACAQNITTITFNSNGGSDILPITKKARTEIKEPTAPTREGYTFEGWYNDDEFTSKFYWTTMPVENKTIIAKWKVNSYSVNFDLNGGQTIGLSGVEYKLTPDIYVFGENITMPSNKGSFSRTGYTFDGWYVDAEATDAYLFNTSMPAHSITLYAKWNINSYTMRFDCEGGTEVDAITQEYNSVVVEPNSIKEGYSLIGWQYFSSAFDIIPTNYDFNTMKMPARNLTLHANWKINSYTMTFDSNGGSTIAPIKQNYNTTIQEPIPTKDGYCFMGWYDKNTNGLYDFGLNGTGSYGEKMKGRDIELIAKWLPESSFTYLHFEEFTHTTLFKRCVRVSAVENAELPDVINIPVAYRGLLVTIIAVGDTGNAFQLNNEEHMFIVPGSIGSFVISSALAQAGNTTFFYGRQNATGLTFGSGSMPANWYNYSAVKKEGSWCYDANGATPELWVL